MEKEHFLKLLASTETSDKEKQLLRLLSQFQSSEEKIIDVDKYIHNLKTLHDSLLQKNTFKEGDIVCWKDGLKNRRIPEYGMPTVVLKILDKPVFDEKEELGSPYYREEADIVLGVLVKEEFFAFHYDSRRFKHYSK